MRYTFEVCRRQVTRKVVCPSCGRSRQKTFTGEATYNPFNKGEPPKQALADAERQADKAGPEVICQRCEDAPNREALVAFANGVPLPERQWGNPTSVLLDRGNIKEVFENAHCDACGCTNWKLTGYELTDKGRRVAEKATQ